MNSRQSRQFQAGFALLKPMIAAGAVLAVVGAVAIPKFVHRDTVATGVTISSDQQAKETALKADLSLLRNAEYKFFSDTNYWPMSLSDLTAASPSALSTPNTALDGAGNKQTIPAKAFHGPYLPSVPTDPISGSAFVYSTEPSTIGKTTSSATSVASDNLSYSQW